MSLAFANFMSAWVCGSVNISTATGLCIWARWMATRCGLGFGAVDLQQVIATLMGKQFEPVAVEERAWGTTFIVRDPDGRRVEVKYESSNRA
jgi:hypothetical protein